MSSPSSTPRIAGDGTSSALQRFLDILEYIGNKFPSPFTLFICLAVGVLALSFVFEGASATYIGAGNKQITVKVVNLINVPSFQSFLADMVKNFVAFPPLGLVVVMMMAMGIAESTGLVTALVRRVLLNVPPWGVTAAIMCLAINGNLASDAATVFMPAVAAAVYAGMGRNPLVGMSVAFAGTQAGFSANFLPAGTDALIAGITATATKILPQTANSPVHVLINYYFMSSSVIILTIVGTYVAEKIVAPRLDRFMPYMQLDAVTQSHELTPEEQRGLKFAGWTTLVYLLLLLAMTVPENGWLRDPKTFALVPRSPLLSGIIPLIFIFFVAVGMAFGIGKGVIKSEADIPKLMANGVSGSVSFIVLAMAASQFIAWFTKSNLATVIAVQGAHFLQSINFTGIPLVIGFMMLSGLADFLLISGSAKWVFFAPIFVPMFGLLGYEPALVQAAYRVGESITNPISPLNYYIPVMLGIINHYVKSDEKKIGYGTIIAAQLPFAFWFAIAWGGWLVLFMLFNWPLGPGAKIYL